MPKLYSNQRSTVAMNHVFNDLNVDDHKRQLGSNSLADFIKGSKFNRSFDGQGLDFNLKPLSYDSRLASQADREIPDLSLEDRPERIMAYAIHARAKYVEKKSEYFLHYSYTLFCLAVYGFECSDLRGKMPLGLYFECSRNIRNEFSNLLKKIRNVCMIYHLGSDWTTEFEEYKEGIIREFNSCFKKKFEFIIEDYPHYDSLLNEQYLIHFEDTVDDYKYFFQEVSYDDQSLEAFNEAARDLLSEKVHLKRPTDLDFMTWISDSKTYDSEHGTSRVNRTMQREHPQTRGSLTSDFRFKRTIVDVAPANVRDTSVCDMNTLFTVKYISFLLRQILDGIEYSAMTTNTAASLRRRKAFKKSSTYIMLDFKKCGITIPHKPIKMVSEILCEFYPEYKDAFEKMSAFENATIEIAGEDRKILRGTGLGNGNEICSLLSCIVAHYFAKTLKWKAIVYNDDSVWDIGEMPKSSSLDLLLTFFEGLGYMCNLRKTFISKFNVFCEEYYFPEEKNWSKRQLSYLPLAGLLLQNSIPNAKRYYRNIVNSLRGTPYNINSYWYVIIGIYGYEFHEFELHLPIEFGGWHAYGDTNFSVVLDLLRNPKDYLVGFQQSYIDLIIRFVQFLLRSGKTSLESFYDTRIEYKTRLKLGLLDPKEYHSLFCTEEVVAKTFRTSSYKDYLKTDLDNLNFRGLHNARPHLRYVLDKKAVFERRKFFELFWKLKLTVPDKYSGYLDGYVVEMLRSAGIAVHFRVPKDEYEVVDRDIARRMKKSKIAIFSVRTSKYPNIRDTVPGDQIQRFLTSRNFIIKSTDIFFFSSCYRRAGDLTLRSEKPICLPSSFSLKETPIRWNMYSDNVYASLCDLMTHHQSAIIPRKFNTLEEDKFVKRFTDLPTHVFSGIENHWKRLKKVANDFALRVFSGYVYEHGLKDRNEFLSLYELVMKVENPKKESRQEIPLRSLIFSTGKFKDVLYGDLSVDAILEEEDLYQDSDHSDEKSDSDVPDDSDYVGTPGDLSDAELEIGVREVRLIDED